MQFRTQHQKQHSRPPGDANLRAQFAREREDARIQEEEDEEDEVRDKLLRSYPRGLLPPEPGPGVLDFLKALVAQLKQREQARAEQQRRRAARRAVADGEGKGAEGRGAGEQQHEEEEAAAAQDDDDDEMDKREWPEVGQLMDFAASADPLVVAWACHALTLLTARNAANRRAFLREGGLPLLVSALNFASPEAQLAAAQCLANVSQEPRAAVMLPDKHALPGLLMLARSPDPRMQLPALITLANLTAVPDNDARLLEAPGFLPTLRAVLKDPANPTLAEHALLLAANVSHSQPAKKPMLQAGLLAPLARFVDPTRPVLSLRAIVALGNLTHDPEAAESLLQLPSPAGLVLIDVLARFLLLLLPRPEQPEDGAAGASGVSRTDLVANACYLLGNLCFASAEARRRLSHLGAEEALARLLVEHEHGHDKESVEEALARTELLELACWLLANLLHGEALSTTQSRARLIEARPSPLPVLLRLACGLVTPGAQENAAAALANLVRGDADAQRALHLAGGVETLAPLLLPRPGREQTEGYAALALGAMAAHPAVLSEIEQRGVLRTLLRRLRETSGEAQCKVVLALALACEHWITAASLVRHDQAGTLLALARRADERNPPPAAELALRLLVKIRNKLREHASLPDHWRDRLEEILGPVE